MFANIKAATFLRSADYYGIVKAFKKYLVPKRLTKVRASHMAMTTELGLKRRNSPKERIDFMTRMTVENGISDEE